MRLTPLGFGLLVPFFAAACGQSLQPLTPFDAGFTPDDLTSGVGSDMAGSGTIDLAGADFAGSTPDSSGPVITYVKPLAGSFVGGLLEVVVTVVDPSGVKPGSVEAVLANDPATKTVVLGPTATQDQYHGFFDLTTLGTGFVFLQINVRADDKLGNHSELGEEAIVDNTPPWMTMDASIQMRVSKLDTTLHECSQLFSPIGSTYIDPAFDNTPEVAYDGATVTQVMGLRARIEDHGNHAPGQRVDYFSDIDETTVTLFVVGSTPGLPALAVDTNGDDVCDDVNPALVPTSGMVTMSNEAYAVAMAPLTDNGAADFTTSSGTVVAGVCDEYGKGTELTPPPLCTKAATRTTFVIPGFGKDKPIYSIPPIKDPDACVGFPVDSANHLPPGPACAVVRAADHAGNHMVSYPIHICIEDQTGTNCSTFVPDQQACTGKLDANGVLMPGSVCHEATPGGNPGTFPKSGEVRDLTLFQ